MGIPISYMASMRALFGKSRGQFQQTPKDYGIDNNTPVMARNAANTSDVELMRLDAEDKLQIGGAFAAQPMRIPWIFRAVPNGACVTTRFHVANYSGRIVGIQQIHNTAGNHASAVTGHITKEKDYTAPGAGVSVMSGTFNLKGTANTLQEATLSSNTADLEFVAGDMHSFKLTGNNATLAGLVVVVWVQPYVRALDVSWYSAAVTAQDQAFFVANRPYALRAMRYVHSAAETTDTSANMQVTQDTSTNAPGAGTNLLTNDSNAGFDVNATANVVQTGAFAATTLATGDRLSVDFADASYTEGAGICVTATFYPEANRLEVTNWLHDTDVVDHWFFISDRDYQLWDGRQIHATAAGGTATANIEKASGTTDASGGTDVLNTAWNLNATANTVQVADYVTTKATTLLVTNDRLSIDWDHTEQSLVGFCQTISLLAR